MQTITNSPHLFLQVLGAALGLTELHLQPARVLLVLVLHGTQFDLQVTLTLLQGVQAAAQSGTLLSGAAQQNALLLSARRNKGICLYFLFRSKVLGKKLAFYCTSKY